MLGPNVEYWLWLWSVIGGFWLIQLMAAWRPSAGVVVVLVWRMVVIVGWNSDMVHHLMVIVIVAVLV